MTLSLQQIAEEQLGKSTPLSVEKDFFRSYPNSPSLKAHLRRIQNSGVLVVQWAATIDNGEGSKGGSKWNPGNWGEHGPIGNLHILVYETDMYESLRDNGKRENYPNALQHLILYGPSKQEWDDGDFLYYQPPAEIFQWRSPSDAVVLFIYESDPDRAITNREHDPLFLSRVTRRETLVSSKTYEGPWNVADDALKRAQKRGGETLLQELERHDVWRNGWRKTMPKMSLLLTTLPTWEELEHLKVKN
jgi:hypothetical protein